MKDFDLKKYLKEGKLLREEITPSREEIFKDFKKMAQNLKAKTGANIDTTEGEKQFRFIIKDLPYFVWWGGEMIDIEIKTPNPSFQESKQAYDSAKEFIDSFTDLYLNYKSFVDKGNQAFKNEVERRRKEIRGDAFEPIEDGEWGFFFKTHYPNFFSKP